MGANSIIADQSNPQDPKYGVGTYAGLLMLGVGIPLLICMILALCRVRWIRIVGVVVIVAQGIMLVFSLGALITLMIMLIPLVTVALLFVPDSTQFFAKREETEPGDGSSDPSNLE